MFDILNKHLNKYLIKIIKEYNEIDIDKLILNFPKKMIFRYSKLKEKFTIEDLIIKSFNLGYKGFFIPECYTTFIEYFALLEQRDKIKIQESSNMIFYSFINDERNIEFINISYLKVYKTVKIK